MEEAWLRMKHLILIGGPMGVGKTSVCRALQSRLPNCVFLDGDWCWDAKPFAVTDETKAMVLDNIAHLLGNFLACSAYDNVLFCWVMHEQAIADAILSRLPRGEYRVAHISLVCSEEALTARIGADVAAGVRTPDVLERALAYLPRYGRLPGPRLDTTHLTVEAAAEALRAQICADE